MKPNEFITSDTHFGHKAVIPYSNRPFSSVEEMDEALIRAWNKKVPEGAFVYHLGDFSFHPREKTLEIIKRLNGHIRLIKGNHDKIISGPVCSLFDWIKDYYESRTEDGRKIVMCHYPLMTWNKSHHLKNSWMCHGHSHGSLKAPKTTRLDVGVDTTSDYAPYSFKEISKILSKRIFCPTDHHISKKDSR